MILRRVMVAAIALVLAFQVVRQGAVDSFAPVRPDAAARVWPGHPQVRITLGMTAIADATRQGQAVTDAALARVYDAGAKAPLAPEPYLVRGVQAQLAGNTSAAERAFTAAKARNPRSLPARYFLADQYLREGDAGAGLREIAVLARLAPNGITSLAPYVATYARQRATWPQLRALFRAEPVLERASLQALAGDAANAGTVLALATRKGPDSVWLPTMVDSLVKAGQYARARQLWASVSGARATEALLYDPGFSEAQAPPPFNWVLTSSAVGLAERQRGGGLHVIYHGREDGALASQVVLLPPGRYRLTSTATGIGARNPGLTWFVQCVATQKEIALRALKDISAEGWLFAVPADCPAQRLQLIGVASDMPQAVDTTIRAIRLTREGANG